ncbi:HNH endonuclease [Bacillus sp. AG4(2022)]|uniref:HNH endonuclease n=1 Tax=Bacillus sp. AG4(2022) TaxID=2962594 RepID=UPI0028825722|nr:HNH endonuclease [Bacillus sp. AG4(2022)]MDT0163831.1 HNH endonuclease [Bacillus sp. AG4(2022)]
MKPWAKKFYKSAAWRKCRNAYFKSKYGLCERCAEPGKIVHHKRYITPDTIDNPMITLNHDNLELLCQDCHNREHHSDGITAEGLAFDSEGNLIKKG